MITFSPSGQFFNTEPEALAMVGPRLGDTQLYKRAVFQANPDFGIRVMRERKDGKVSKRWWVRYLDGGGVDKTDLLGEAKPGTMNAALEQALKKIRDMDAIRPHKVGSVPTFEVACDQYIELKSDKDLDRPISKSTIDSYKKCKARLAHWYGRRADQITKEDGKAAWKIIEACVQEKAAEWNQSWTGTQAAAQSLIFAHAVFQWLKDKGTITLNPLVDERKKMLNIKPKRPTKAIHRKLLPKVYRWLELQDADVRWFITIGICLAFRKGVIQQMQWSWIDMDTRTMVIPGAIAGNKSREDFALPISDWLWENVFLKARAAHPHSKWVIPSPVKDDAPRRDITSVLKSLNRDLESDGVYVHPHTLRASAASLFYATIKDGLLTSRLLGHKVKVKTDDVKAVTAGYIDNPEADMRDAVNRVAERFLEICDPEALAAWLKKHDDNAPDAKTIAALSTARAALEDDYEVPDWKLID